MMVAFSGNNTTLAPVNVGRFAVTHPTSIRTQIREAMAWGLMNLTGKANGYKLDMGEVHVNAPANDNARKKYPSIDIIWLQERYTNNVNGGNSLGGYNKIASVLVSGRLVENQCSLTPEDIVLLREHFIADIEKFFGTYYYIPDSTYPADGNWTVFNSILVNNTPYGIEATEPKGGVDMELEVYYRIELTNPNQTF